MTSQALNVMCLGRRIRQDAMAMRPSEARILLGLRDEPSEEELLTAYRAMLRAWHPDRFPKGSDLHEVSNQRTRSIIEAFQLLSDELTARQELGVESHGPGTAADDAKRPRDPLRFDGPTPEKTVPHVDASSDRVRSRPWAAAAALVVVLSGAGVLVLARGGVPVEGAVLPSVQATADVSSPAPVASGIVSDVPVSANGSDDSMEPPTVRVARYSMAIGAFRDRNRAMTVVEQLGERAPNVWTTTVPVRVGETVFHRILVGFTDDRDVLGRVVEQVSSVLGEDPGPWIMREAGLALCLSGGGSLQEARQRVAELDHLGISAFVLRVPSTDREARIRVCSGSFEAASEADHLKETLARAGFDAFLEPRVGEPVY